MVQRSVIYGSIVAGVIVGAIALIGNWIDGKRQYDIYYNTGQVTELGQCSKTECSYTYKDKNGEEHFASYHNPVSVGQLVYQMCWSEKVRGDRCYVEYHPSK